jgi:hypothetical protein
VVNIDKRFVGLKIWNRRGWDTTWLSEGEKDTRMPNPVSLLLLVLFLQKSPYNRTDLIVRLGTDFGAANAEIWVQWSLVAGGMTAQPGNAIAGGRTLRNKRKTTHFDLKGRINTILSIS